MAAAQHFSVDAFFWKGSTAGNVTHAIFDLEQKTKIFLIIYNNS